MADGESRPDPHRVGRQGQTWGDPGTQSHGTRTRGSPRDESAGLPDWRLVWLRPARASTRSCASSPLRRSPSRASPRYDRSDANVASPTDAPSTGRGVFVSPGGSATTRCRVRLRLIRSRPGGPCRWLGRTSLIAWLRSRWSYAHPESGIGAGGSQLRDLVRYGRHFRTWTTHRGSNARRESARHRAWCRTLPGWASDAERLRIEPESTSVVADP